MANLITTKDKVISCIASESEKEAEECALALAKTIDILTKNRAEKLMVLNLVLRELLKLTPKHEWIKFDFGERKRFELRRLK